MKGLTKMQARTVGNFFVELGDEERSGFRNVSVEGSGVKKNYRMVSCPYTKKWFGKLTEGDLSYIVKMYPEGMALTTDEDGHTLKYRS